MMAASQTSVQLLLRLVSCRSASPGAQKDRLLTLASCISRKEAPTAWCDCCLIRCSGSETQCISALVSVWRCACACSFPAARLKRTPFAIAISPPDQYDLNVLLGWAFRPAEDQVLLAFLDQGRQDALAWAEENEVLEGAGLQDGEEAGQSPTDVQVQFS